MSFEGSSLRVAVLPSGNGYRDAHLSAPGTLYDLNGRSLRVDRSFQAVSFRDGRCVAGYITLVQDREECERVETVGVRG